MRIKLHFVLLAFLFVTTAFSQPSAYQAPDISQCGNEVFDLTQQTPIILGNQQAPEYSLAYYTNQSDAYQGINAIPNPGVFVGQQQQYIFARVTDSGGNFAISGFGISWNFVPQLSIFPNVYACESYELAPLQFGNYFSGPGGTGEMYDTFYPITYSQQVFVYVQAGNCSDEQSFFVTINSAVQVIQLPDVTTCDSYVLPNLDFGNYYTDLNGSGTLVAAGTEITQATTLYIYGQTGDCSSQTSFHITVSNNAAPILPLVTCDTDGDGFTSFDLNGEIPTITSGQPGLSVTFYDTFAAAQSGTGNLASPYTNTISGTQDIYVRIDHATGCHTIGVMTLNAQFCGTISGTVTIDSDLNGCTAADVRGANLQISATHDNEVHYAYTNSLGQYAFSEVPLGSNYVHAQVSAQIGNALPDFQNFTISVANPTATADFCITPNAPFNDAGVYFYPTFFTTPGMATSYNVTVHNYGNTVLDGTATLNYDGSKITFISASPAISGQSANTLNFNFSGLMPSQNRSFTVWFQVAAPPVVVGGTVLAFSAAVATTQNDINATNNTTVYNQAVLSSYDPNEIYVQQGPFILPSQASNYLNYTIRFQNTGDAAATTVRLENILDDKLDWSTFRPVAASHNYTAERVGGKVTFTFNNINLPAESADGSGSQGYVTYEVKPISGLAIGDIISNTADIYFDLNAPVATNTVTTQLVSVLDVAQNNLQTFAIYPNPATKVFTVSFGDAKPGNVSIGLYDLQGKLILENKDLPQGNKAVIDISKVQSGMYFVKIGADGKSTTKKLIVE